MDRGSGAAGLPNSMWVVMCYSLQSMSVTEKSVICMSEHIGVEKASLASFNAIFTVSKFT